MRKLLPVYLYIYGQSFVSSAALTRQHYHWYAASRFAFPEGSYSLVDYSRKQTESCSNWVVGTTPMISACWRLMQWDLKNSGGRDSNPRPVEPEASVQPTTPQRPTSVAFTFLCLFRLHDTWNVVFAWINWTIVYLNIVVCLCKQGRYGTLCTNLVNATEQNEV